MPATDWKEDIAADETERFTRHAEFFGELQRARGGKGTVHRALHAKSNVGVEAVFEVLPGLPDEARIGLFAEPATYPAFVRFSNGAARHQPDVKPDVRGIAVKLLNVGGRKLIPGLEDATTQDFLAIRTPTVPMRTADEFVMIVKAAQSPALLPFKLIGGLGVRRGFSLVKALVSGLKLPMTTLATTSYYGALPIKYGPYAVHFGFFPPEPAVPSRGDDPMYIGNELAARLRESAVTYEMRVQFYEDATKTPIEDPTVEWTTPWVTIAKLTLPKQDPDSPRGKKIGALVEQMSFDPWHAREDLRPLGNLMRARNHAYRISTKGRGAIAEPASLPSFE